MNRVFDFVPAGDVLSCQLVCARWYNKEVHEYYRTINSLSTKLFKIGTEEQMQTAEDDYVSGFDVGTAAFSAHLVELKFQTGNWG